MKKIIHRIAAIIAFLTIATFFTTTLLVEVFGSYELIATVKSMITVPGLPLLILAMAATGGTGFSLSNRRKGKLLDAKRKRMPFIAANGLLVLVPCAIYLNKLASTGTFNSVFYMVQSLELTAGFVNLILITLNIRDGMKLSGRLRNKKTKIKATSEI